jgi:hypothetical protein
VIIFNESLMHTPTPVLSQRTRYATFTWIGAPWVMDNSGTPPYEIRRFVDDDLYGLFRPANREGATLPPRNLG